MNRAAAMAPLDHIERAARLRSALAVRGSESLLLTDLTNIRWVCGFTGSNGWLLVTADELVLFTDGRYTEQAEQQVAIAGLAVSIATSTTRSAMTNDLAEAVRRLAPATVGFEGAHMTYADHASLSGAVGGEWVATDGVLQQLRRTKDQGEIERMSRAATIADDALVAALPMLASEPTEVQFRDVLEAEMRSRGADGPSFDTIVAAGANAALPHHHPDGTRIVEGMTVVIDFGALYDGYHSDMTRTYTMGDPSPMQAEVYEVVLAAQRAGVAGVRPGAGGRALDGVCRDSITAAGWGQWFNHGTGHGVGLQIHESPWLTQTFDDTLAAMDVVTVEPGVYRRDFGGVRIEDMVLVTTDGCLPLTNTPKDSACLPSRPTT